MGIDVDDHPVLAMLKSHTLNVRAIVVKLHCNLHGTKRMLRGVVLHISVCRALLRHHISYET